MCPLKMFEYMAAGRPIVATDFSVVREVLRDGETALLVKPDSAEALREGILELLRDSARSKSLASRCLEQVKEYSWTRRAQRILSALLR